MIKRVFVFFPVLFAASALLGEVKVVRIQFESCLRAACVADATNAVKAANIGLLDKEVKVVHVDDGLGQFNRDPKTPMDLRRLAKEVSNHNSGIKIAILEISGAISANSKISEPGQDLSVSGKPCSVAISPQWGKAAPGKTWLVWQPTAADKKGSGPLEVCIVR